MEGRGNPTPIIYDNKRAETCRRAARLYQQGDVLPPLLFAYCRQHHRKDNHNAHGCKDDLQHPCAPLALQFLGGVWFAVLGFFACHFHSHFQMFIKGGCHRLFKFFDRHRFHDIGVGAQRHGFVYDDIGCLRRQHHDRQIL